ncbi:MAG TPA: AMP-binding protein, partial [Thermoanaerobaculia bacterium]
NLAYVIYTSGSTGKPKGVAVQQGTAAEHMATAAAAFGLSGGDRMLQFVSPSFDLWLEQTVPALISGAALVLRGMELWEPARLLARIRALGVTVAGLPTAYWQQWVREYSAEEKPEEVPVCLRLVMAGGEAMPAEVARLWWRSPLRGVRLLNGYGPTEAVISATFCTVEAPLAPAVSIPLGRPLSGRSLRVLDRLGQLTPAGAAGEIFLGGAGRDAGLARGYLHRPDLTAERFVPDPFAPEAGGMPGGRLYRTGDLARHLSDGQLEYLGRIDQQVKVRGFRIELGEVEAALLAHPAVREAAVVVQDGGAGLAAYVVMMVTGETGEARLAQDPLRDFLRERLPGFMVPAAFVFLPAMPLTPAGKVDRRALARLRPERSAASGTAPRTPTEELVAGIFTAVLGLQRVGVEESFFALGGHSLLATQVTSRVRTLFGAEMPVRVVFETPTVEGLAGWLERSARSAPEAMPPLVRVSREETPVLSFAQQRLWFLDQLAPGSPLYNIPAAVDLAGRLDYAALAAALGEVVRRHEALRTTFRAVAGEPVPVVAAATGFVLPLVDLQGLPGREREDEAGRLAVEEARRPFDLNDLGGLG